MKQGQVKSSAPVGGQIEEVETKKLDLDPQNPRLSRKEEGSSQPELIAIMLERFKVEQLAESFLATGYVPLDPLLVVRDGKRCIVVEGNRRVAALKLLLDPGLAPPNRQATWSAFSKRLPEGTRSKIKRVSVLVFPSREDPQLSAYVGFRHVTGPLKWPALEKASYIAYLIGLGWPYKAIAERLSSTPRQIERNYIAYQVAQQAVAEGLQGAEQMEDLFGVLLRALQAQGVGEFLGITYPNDPKKSETPIPNSRKKELGEFVKWTFGVKDQLERVLRDSRDLTKWGKILQSKEALGYLRRSERPTFGQAWLRSGGESETLVETLRSAADRLQDAVPLVRAHKNESDVKSAVDRIAEFFAQILTHFPDTASARGLALLDK